MADDAIHIPRELIQHLNRGDCVLFVGDALDEEGSQSARLASALVDAADAHSACPVSECQSGECARPGGCAVPLTRAAQLYESRTNRQALVDFVLRRIDNSRPPGPLHRALAALPVRVIVTTAYDDRLEAALRQAGRSCLPVVQDTDVPFDDPDRVQLVRLRGTVRSPESLVLTEDDAADFFARLPAVTNILRGHFASKTLLFVGYRLNDRHFLDLYRQVTGPIARYRRLAYGVQWPPDPLAVDRWRNKVTLIEAEPLPFVEQLTRSIRVQEEEEKRAALPSEPYKFLDYYTREDAAIFFGRDLEADLLLSRILARDLTVFYGRSGTGKTSLLLARVAPALEEAGYRVAYARMLGDPASEVKAAVRGVPLGQLAHTDKGRRLRDVLADALPPAGRLVVLLDQFEEFFLRQGAAVRQAFAQELADCLRSGLDLRFVLSLRDDYLGALDELSGVLPEDVFAHRYKLENLTREKALLAILKPAEAFGLPVEEALRERLIADLEDQGLEPANLQIVLYRLYRDAVERGLWSEEQKQGAGLTLACYDALGGTREILAGYLDEVLAELPDEVQRKQAQAILKRMVTAQQTKAAVSGQEIARDELLARVGLSEAELDELLGYLRQRRVVRKFGDEDRYELAHEVMVEKVWDWVSEEELRLLDVRDMLRRAMSDHEKFGDLLTQEKLARITSCCDALALETADLELLLRSALAMKYEVEYWTRRAHEGGVAGEVLAAEGLAAESFRTRAAAVRLLALGEGFFDVIIGMLDDDYPQVRMAAITALEQLRPDGAWRDRLVYECYVPAGPFKMGSEDGRDNEKPVHEVHLDAYYIGKYPVTNAEYVRYKEDVGQPFQVPAGKADHPVVEVSWYDARDYAAWAGMRLPSEAEWEKAARGTDGRIYPWGDDPPTSKLCNFDNNERDTTPVGTYSPQGDSPYGCADMAGNVWEWCRTRWQGSYEDYRDDNSLEGSERRVLRGGAFLDYVRFVRCASRGSYSPDFRDRFIGFRVVASPVSASEL